MLFKFYLIDRIQTFKINNILSEYSIITFSGPQETVLCLMYVNDLLNIPNLPEIICSFTDDGVILLN